MRKGREREVCRLKGGHGKSREGNRECQVTLEVKKKLLEEKRK